MAKAAWIYKEVGITLAHMIKDKRGSSSKNWLERYSKIDDIAYHESYVKDASSTFILFDIQKSYKPSAFIMDRGSHLNLIIIQYLTEQSSQMSVACLAPNRPLSPGLQESYRAWAPARGVMRCRERIAEHLDYLEAIRSTKLASAVLYKRTSLLSRRYNVESLTDTSWMTFIARRLTCSLSYG